MQGKEGYGPVFHMDFGRNYHRKVIIYLIIVPIVPIVIKHDIFLC